MSQWTHVAGIIRVDSFWGIIMQPDQTAELLRRIFKDPPKGSEGAAKIDMLITREHNSMSWGHLCISGDLRNVGETEEDIQSIVTWFKDCLGQFPANKLMARDAVLSIEIEYKDKILLTLDPNGKATDGKPEVLEHRIKREEVEA